MLVLSRKADERIRIGENIWITVVDIRLGSVRIGIDAPPSMPIVREELLSHEPRKECDDAGDRLH